MEAQEENPLLNKLQVHIFAFLSEYQLRQGIFLECKKRVWHNLTF